MASINLGSFNTSNGRTTGLGAISGLDSNALIESILQAKVDSVKSIQDTIDVNKTKTSAVSQLRTLLDRFKTASDLLRSPSGVRNDSNDLFKHTTTSLVSSTAISASNYLSVSSEAGATLNNYSITNIVKAYSHQIRKDGFTSKTASVVGNLSVADNYQANSLNEIVGNVLNSSTPIITSNDIQGKKASVDLTFGNQNAFDANDEITFGSTTITFGGTGGNDIDISGLTTVAQKVAAIAARMNEISIGDESRYSYIASGNTITVQRDVAGSNAEVGTSLNISADFAADATNSTQTVKIGNQPAAVSAAGGALNTLGTDGNQGTEATNATMQMVFGSQNKFDATDSITFGNTTITFGGTGGSDLNISSATSLDDKLDAIVAYMNSVATGVESTYTYSRSSSGIITVTQDTAGTIASTGNNMTVSADFSKGTADKTQTVAIGANYKNNGSAEGSVTKSNGPISGSVSANGVDGRAGATKANVSLQFANNNFDASDTLVIGGTTLTFGGGGGNDITVGATLHDTIVNIANRLNALSSGAEAGYTYTTNGTDSLIITRDLYGNNASVTTNLALDANLSGGGDSTNTLKIGNLAAASNPAATTLNVAGTDGVNLTAVSDAKTSHISSLSGAINVTGATFISGTSSATGFTPNTIEFKVTIGGETYTSKPVALNGGSINGAGAGNNGLGNTIASGTAITFVKDIPTDGQSDTSEVTFSLVVGDAVTIADQTAATAYAASMDTWLNTTNSITITQSPATPPLRAGTFTLGGVDITLAEGDSLSVIKSKINAVSATSGVIADIVQISADNFSLVLKSTNTGIANKIFEFADGDIGDGTAGTLQLGSDNVSFTLTQAARDASITIDGQTITRASNNISDVVDKLTFSIVSDSPVDVPPTLTLNVTSNNDTIKTGITDFLDAYNELKIFISKQTQRDDNNELVEGAVLGDDSILRNLLTDIDNELSRSISGLSAGAKNTLFSVGIDTFNFPGDSETPATKDIFIIDESKFDAALSSAFDEVMKVFTFSFKSSSLDLGAYSHTNALSLNNFVLDIDTSRAEGDRVRVRDATTNQILFNADLSNGTITGRKGTALEGLVMIYTGDGTDTISVNATSGIADRVYNLLNNYLQTNGKLDTFLKTITDENTRLQENITQENLRIEEERELLIAQFSQLESVISQANNVLSFLEAQRTANDSK